MQHLHSKFALHTGSKSNFSIFFSSNVISAINKPFLSELNLLGLSEVRVFFQIGDCKKKKSGLMSNRNIDIFIMFKILTFVNCIIISVIIDSSIRFEKE